MRRLNYLQLLPLLLLVAGFSASDDDERFQKLRQVRAALNAAAAEHSLIDNSDCGDVRKVCTHLKSTDNLSVLECVDSFTSSQLEALHEKCQHAIWRQQRQLLSSSWLQEELLARHCPAERGQLESCANALDMWSCLNEHVAQPKFDKVCRAHVNRVYAMLFPDYETLGNYFAACDQEIEQLSCGRVNVEHRLESQLETAQCLQETAGTTSLSNDCKAAIANIQQTADVELFKTCAADLHRLCEKEQADASSAFKCLLKNKGHPTMSKRCRNRITQHDREIGRNYRLSHGLAKACKDDIKQHHCRRGVSEDKQVRLAQILLCLESITKNGTRIAAECSAEILDHRRMLMQDYQLSPEILSDCSDDIQKLCEDADRPNRQSVGAVGGEIIHCLMEHARSKRRKDRVTAQCQRSLETLIKVSDAGEDWRVDPVLRRACKPVVDAACSDTDGGEARVMSCLMERIGTPVMHAECEKALLLIQYFVVRDFKLDPQLYKHCHDDAVKYCRAKQVWDDVAEQQMDPERGPLILPCLHSIAYGNNHTQQISLRKDCLKEVKRVMRQRAISVDLIPEVEDVCLNDLSRLCSERTERGAEMECLQINLENLQPECKTAVSAYTEEEAAHVELNPVIMSVCSEAMNAHCEDILKGDKDNDDMMDCLISHKNDADMRQDLKCRAAIEHFQIISLKNYHFTYKFKEFCRPHVNRFCATKTNKNEVVACLSEVMRNDTISGKKHQIPKECRQQVKAQLYQQRESISLDPKLAKACQTELEKLCADEKGPGQALECLTQKTASLGASCHHAIFLIKKSELGDSDTDYTLINTCKEMIYKHCPKVESTDILNCLKSFKDDSLFDKRCHLVVVNRMIEQNTDFRFNPTLQLACGKNIDQYCSDIVAAAKPNEELNGKVMQCLKNKFRESRLDEMCGKQVLKILQEQANNYKLDPLLQNFCSNEILILCEQHLNNEKEYGLVAECLKTAFINHKIINRECKVEVARLIAEAKADIHVDPVLEKACIQDLLRYCLDVPSGNGRKLKCLQVLLQDQSKAMDADCRMKLEQRIEMFQNADTVLSQPPEDMQSLVTQVITSPAKKFFIAVLMTAVGMVFLMGIFLGRVTKRAINIKNK